MPLSTDLTTDYTVGESGHVAAHEATNTRVNAIATEVNAHEADTTGVHGITDTSVLVTTTVTNALDARLDTLEAGGGVRPTQTVVVAASNSPLGTAFADYTCTGTADQTTINTAIASVATGGRVLLMVGTYNLTGPVVIDRSWITVEGPCVPMWGGYPGEEGNACAKLKVGSTGVHGIEIRGLNPTGDEGRHKGITVRKLYLYGFSQTGTGVLNRAGSASSTSGGLIDWCHFNELFVHNFQHGIDINGDTPQIVDNSVQFCSGDGIRTTGVYGRIAGNLIYDNGGTGIYSASTSIGIVDNVVGHCGASGYGIAALNTESVVAGNRIRSAGLNLIRIEGAGSTVTGNAGIFGGDASANSTADGISVAADECTIVGNTVKNSASSTGYAVALSGTGCVVQSNVLRGTGWNSGGARISRGTGNIIRGNPGYVSEKSGVATSVADGGTITHGLARAPESVRVTGTVASQIVSVTTVSSTTLTVSIKTDAGAAGTTQSVYWQAEVGDTAPGGESGSLPTVTSGTLLGHWKADAITGLSDGATVTTWTDSSGNGRDLTGAGTPLYKTSQLNSLPSIRFSGSSGNYLGAGTLSGSQPVTIFFVARRPSAASGLGSIVSSGPSSDCSLFLNGSLAFGGYAGLGADLGTAAANDVGHVFEAVLQGASTVLKVDGTGGTRNLGTNGFTGITVGSKAGRDGEWFNGDLFEVVAYSGALSSGDLTSVRAYLGTKYSITVA